MADINANNGAAQREDGVRKVRTGRVSPAEMLARRALIISTATEEFLVNGFARTSVSVIAKKCRVSKGTIYADFPSKEDLFLTVASDCLNSFHQELTALIKDAMTEEVPRSLREVVRETVALVIRHVSTPRMNSIQRMVVTENGNFPAVGEMLERLSVSLLEPLASYLRAQAGPEVMSVKAAHLYALHLQSLAMGGTASLFIQPDRLYSDLEVWIDIATDLFVNGIGAQIPPSRQPSN